MTLRDIAARFRDRGEYHKAVEVEILHYRCRKLGARIRRLDPEDDDQKARRTFRMRAS